MEKETVLITTIYKASSVIQVMRRFSPKKVYFIIDDPEDDVRKNSINMIKDLFSEVKFGPEIKVKIYDIVNIASECINVIYKERVNRIIMNVTEGRKTMSFGMLLASYVMKKNIDSVYYIIEETNQPIKLPIVQLSITEKKAMILKELRKGIMDIGELERITSMKPGTLYVHLKDLRDEGFITKDNKLTEMGEVVLLNI